MFNFEHVKFEMNVRHTNGNVKLADVYTSLEFRGEVQAGD